MANAVNRIKKAFTNIPSSLREAGKFILEMAERQKRMNEIKREAKKKIKELSDKMEEDLKTLRSERDTFFNALFAFAEPKKEELTEELRTVKLPEGDFGWRWTPPAVVIKNGLSDADIIAYLKKIGLHHYIRVVEEVDREALLRVRPNLPVIAYEQREEFFAKPKLKKGEGSSEEITKTDTIDR
ncbi:MAG: hypothetical protein QG653_132 [Patescibacteria group bacterium]|nr:hypothetical protein [Patescibacteria group bacterium]